MNYPIDTENHTLPDVMASKTGFKKVSTGIEGFDAIAHGGIPQGRTTLLSGTSGSGKTVCMPQ